MQRVAGDDVLVAVCTANPCHGIGHDRIDQSKGALDMLTVYSERKQGFCDGQDRRDFLRLGALGLGGLTLGRLFELEARAGIRSSHKAIINIHLGGGPSHQDMFDLKPDAPVEFRGEFNPVATNVPGLEICEHMPMLAQMADKYAVLRSLVGMYEDHSNFHTHTGYGRNDLRNVGGRPSIGSVVSRLFGPTGSGAPPFISYNGAIPGYLGPVHKPYQPQDRKSTRLNSSH